MFTFYDISNKNCQIWKYYYLLENILKNIFLFDSYEVTHCYHEDNKIVDFLANKEIGSQCSYLEVCKMISSLAWFFFKS